MLNFAKILPLVVMLFGSWTQADEAAPMIQGKYQRSHVMAFPYQLYVKAVYASVKNEEFMKYELCRAETINACISLGNGFLKMSQVKELDARLEKQKTTFNIHQSELSRKRRENKLAALQNARLVLTGQFSHGLDLIPAINAIQTTLFEGKIPAGKLGDRAILIYN